MSLRGFRIHSKFAQFRGDWWLQLVPCFSTLVLLLLLLIVLLWHFPPLPLTQAAARNERRRGRYSRDDEDDTNYNFPYAVLVLTKVDLLPSQVRFTIVENWARRRWKQLCPSVGLRSVAGISNKNGKRWMWRLYGIVRTFLHEKIVITIIPKAVHRTHILIPITKQWRTQFIRMNHVLRQLNEFIDSVAGGNKLGIIFELRVRACTQQDLAWMIYIMACPSLLVREETFGW